MSGNYLASAMQWVFGTAAVASTASSDKLIGSPNNVLGSTGAGAAFNTHRQGESFSFLVETDGNATCSYQIRTARSNQGPWAILSSGTLSTGACDIVQLPGPLFWLSPRIKTLNSTANQVIVRMSAR